MAKSYIKRPAIWCVLSLLVENELRSRNGHGNTTKDYTLHLLKNYFLSNSDSSTPN